MNTSYTSIGRCFTNQHAAVAAGFVLRYNVGERRLVSAALLLATKTVREERSDSLHCSE
jgi:hypothetical protein